MSTPFAIDEDAADRHLACQIDIEEAFVQIAEAEPERHWTGDEAAFWPVRASAAVRGWSPQEIDDALMDLAACRHLGRLANRLTDEQIASARRMLDEPEWPAAPAPPSALLWVLLGAGVTSATLGLIWLAV